MPQDQITIHPLTRFAAFIKTGVNKFIVNCVSDGYHLLMRPETEEMSSEEIKAWVLSREFPPLRCELPMGDQITLTLRDMGFERVRVNQVVPHPVWNVGANAGRFRADNLRALKVALKKLCCELGFRVRMNEIAASLYRGRINASFALVAPDAATILVEHDGEWLPEHLEAPPW